MTTVTITAIGTAAILWAAAVVVALGLRPLVVKALDYVDGVCAREGERETSR